MTQNETEDERIRALIDQRLSELTGQDVSVSLPGDPGTPAPQQTASLSDILDGIDPKDSDSAMELFGWLVDNGRLNRVATLTQGGYLFIYQEPEGSSKQGWVAGGTTGDRIVDDALDQARGSGPAAAKGLCKHCYSAIQRTATDEFPQAENPRPGEDPGVCDKAPDGKHEFHEFAG